MKKLKMLVSLILVVAILAAPSALADNKEIAISEEGEFFSLVTDFVLENYQFDLSKDMLLERTFQTLLKNDPDALDTFLAALFGSLDEYSEFFSPEEWQHYIQQMENVVGGIGVSMSKNGEYVEIISVIDGSPAQQAGLRPGDKFTEVNGHDVISQDVSYVSALVTGEIGTTVQIKILRGGETLSFELTRYELKHDSVAYMMLDADSAYIVIGSFNLTTADELSKILKEIDASGVKKIILDLRNNPGGYVDTAVKAAGNFVPEGKIASLKFKSVEQPQDYMSTLKNTKYELAVLVNENTASAAELLSSAIQDSGAGKIIGQQTYGKGIIQTSIPLYAGRVCKMTTGEYLTRNGRSIHGKGVLPDVDVANRRILLSDTNISDMRYKDKYVMGDAGEGVFACKQRLDVLGYLRGDVNDVFDGDMHDAVTRFQRTYGIAVTGELDITTQIYLDDKAMSIQVNIDKQLVTALDLLKIDYKRILREDIK